MKISHRDVIRLCPVRNSATTSSDITSSEYARPDGRREPDGANNAIGFFFSLAYHSRGVTARSAGGKALNHQSQTPLNRGLTAPPHLAEATLDDFATSENAETETDLYGWSER